MNVRIVQNSFVGGELSPALYGRHDIDAYFKGAAKIENFVVLRTGGVRKRPGTAARHAFTLANGESRLGLDARIVPYRYSQTDGGLLIVTDEAGGGSTRVTRVTYIPKGASGSEYATPGTTPATALLPHYIHPPSLRFNQIGDTLFLSGESGPAGSDGAAPSTAPVATVLINHPARTLTVGSFTISPKPNAPYYIIFTPIGDTMIVSSTSTKARTLNYAAYTVLNGVLSNPVYLTIANTNAEWPLNCSILITVTVRPDSGGNWPDEIIIAKRSGSLYGELVRLQLADSYLSGTDGTGQYKTYQFEDQNHLPGALIYKQTPLFTEGAAVSAECTAVYQQRLAFAGLPGEPFSVLFSRVGDFRSFHAGRPVADDDPFRLTLATGSPAVIRHMTAYRDGLLLFTDTGVHRVSGSPTEGFGPRTVRTDLVNDIGCDASVRPVQTTDGVLYVGADGRTVYELRYDAMQDAPAPSERTILAGHLTEGRRILSMSHQRWPESVVWLVLDNGRILSFTYQPEHAVYAWARHGIANLNMSIVQIACAGAVTDGTSDMVMLCEQYEWKNTRNACEILFFSPALSTDISPDRPVAAELVTLRPELPDRNVQGVKKNITDCLIRVRNTNTLTVRPNDAQSDGTLWEPDDKSQPFTGNVKIMPRGLVNDDGQMSIASPSGFCEIQCVVWTTEF